MRRIDKERLLELLDKFIERSERWIIDADLRNDNTDIIYYDGQKKVVREIRNIVSKW